VLRYRWSARSHRPCCAVAGDYLSLSVEEALFGILFGYMAYFGEVR